MKEKKYLRQSVQKIGPKELEELLAKGIKLRQVGRPEVVVGNELDAIEQGFVVQPYRRLLPPRKDGKFPDFYMVGEAGGFGVSSYPLVFYEIIKSKEDRK